MSIIKLQSSDGKIFLTDREAVNRFGVIKTMLETVDWSDEERKRPIPLPKVNSTILELLLIWAEERPLRIVPDSAFKEKRTDNIPKYDTMFLNYYKDHLFELMTAANYLDIEDLMQSTSKTVANHIKIQPKMAEDDGPRPLNTKKMTRDEMYEHQLMHCFADNDGRD